MAAERWRECSCSESRSMFSFMCEAARRNRAGRFSALLRGLFFIGRAAALFACIDFYFQFAAPAGYGAQFIWLETGVFRRAQGLFYEASTLGNFCAFFLVMAMAALFARPRIASLAGVAAGIGERSICDRASAFVFARFFGECRSRIVCIRMAEPAENPDHWRADNRMGVRGSRIRTGARLCPDFGRVYWLRIVASAVFFFDRPTLFFPGGSQSWAFLQGLPR